MLLNSVALKLSSNEIEFEVPRHQFWALEIFASIRSDLVPDFVSKLRISQLVTPQILLDITKKQFAQGRYNDASLMIVRYKFHAHFDLHNLMLRLVDMNKLETAKLLIQADDKLKVELIKSLSTNDNVKKAGQLIKDFKFNIDDFPEVKERIMKNSMRYFLGRNLYKKQDQRDFLTLDRVEDLLVGIKQMLGYLVEDLAHKNKKQEAKGIMLRNKVETHIRAEILELLDKVEYDETKDSSLQKHDAFEPLSRPKAEYVQLPAHVKVDWVGTDDDVSKMAILLEDEFVGVDSEWRPQLTQLHKTKPSLFQISGAKNAFLIDLVSLQKSKVLDDMLSRIFSNPTTVVIGFGFSSDIEQFARKLPHLNFIKYVKNFIDAQTYFGKIYLVEQQTGLAKVAQKIFNKTICKVEQMSNWERRPLRLSQQHYGALDAYILIDIVKHLIEKAQKDKLREFDFFKRTLDNRKIILTADEESDDEDGIQRAKRLDERVVADNSFQKNKKQTWMQSNGPTAAPKQEKPYGNSYGKKGQTNNLSFLHNDELRASMWQTKGFIVDKNLTKLGRML